MLSEIIDYVYKLLTIAYIIRLFIISIASNNTDDNDEAEDDDE